MPKTGFGSPTLSNSSSLDEGNEDGVFDFEDFCSNMKKSISVLQNKSDVELGYYLQGYTQLHQFFILLGGAFQFVASDVKSKIKILNEYRNAELQNSKSIKNFSTVKAMVNYEKELDGFRDSKFVSGCRTLLRLHRGLDFIQKFLKEIYKLEDGVKLGGVARNVYDQTLAEHHTWVVRNTARVAMQFLPTRIELLKKISQDDDKRLSNILLLFPQALETMHIVYDRVQDIYSDNQILNLP